MGSSIHEEAWEILKSKLRKEKNETQISVGVFKILMFVSLDIARQRVKETQDKLRKELEGG